MQPILLSVLHAASLSGCFAHKCHLLAVYLVGDENPKAGGSLLEHLESVLVSAVIPKVDGDDVITLIQAQGLQHV